MKAVLAAALLAPALLIAACSAGGKTTNRPAPPPARPTAGISLRQLATGTPGPAAGGAPQAAGVARTALAAFPQSAPGGLQLLVPQLFSNASALDLLRLSTDVGAPAPTVPSLLQGLGWSWLVVEDGIEGGGSYRQWRVVVLGFAGAEGAAQYLAHPFLLPPALTGGSTGDLPSSLPAGTRLLRAADTIVPVTNPAVELAGERAALLWQRGRLIFQLIESAAPAPIDLALLSELAGIIDQRHEAIPGGAP